MEVKEKMTNKRGTAWRSGRRLRRRVTGRREGGQSLVEFALVLPFFLVLFFGIVEFGNAWRKYSLITNGAREGAREAVLPSSSQTTVETTIHSYLNGSGLDTTQANLSLAISSVTGTADTVQIDYPHQFVLLGGLIDLMCSVAGCNGTAYSTVTLSTTSIMRNE
ncbi:MAG: TadE/TadG family type IV pilus assembly protein [Planctomycetota bacterium]|jgi:Flp pilus assembly protein TadG